MTTITVDRSVHEKLAARRLHSKEPFNDVLARLLEANPKVDVEALEETISILSDPETMAALAESVAQLREGGPLYSIDDV